jgi:hypothetical protein
MAEPEQPRRQPHVFTSRKYLRPRGARAPPLSVDGCNELSAHSALNQTKKGGFFTVSGWAPVSSPPFW